MVAQVQVVCQNWREDRVIPRMARALADRLGWALGEGGKIIRGVKAVYLSAYFEARRLASWPGVPVGAYLTHREEEPPGNAKAETFDSVAKRVDLRVTTCQLYADYVRRWGPTIQAAAPLERDRFVIRERQAGRRLVAGFSGYTYANRRKGEDLAKAVVVSDLGRHLDWRASGRGWPVPTERHRWEDMPGFYQGLDILVVPSRVEGIPMPPLEALACGVSIVIPHGVGLLDELPEALGIHRYARGDLGSLQAALRDAVDARPAVDREALRAATGPYSVEAWCRDVKRGMEAVMSGGEVPTVKPAKPTSKGTGSKRGIYCVAFGDPARWCALRLIKSIKVHMPDVPVCLCADSPLGLEDLFVKQPDSDVGGRRAKLRAYELAPAEWQAVLYLDADTEVVGPDIVRYFEWVEAGWEFVIAKDPHLMDTMASFRRANNSEETAAIEKMLGTLDIVQLNGGVWAFGRSERIAAFFRRWQEEWEVYAQRDQGALFRALRACPLRMLVLGNEWNTFPKYCQGVTTAGLMHYPGSARRWKGAIPGRIDGKQAWEMSKQYLRQWKPR